MIVSQKGIDMEISFYTNPGDLHTYGGYGRAGFSIVTSLQKLGHKVPWNDPSADAKLNFCWPSEFVDHLSPNQHNIYLAVYESTKLQPEWYEILDNEPIDEIWTASTWFKNVMEDNGYKVSKVYPHGVDAIWKPQKRQVNDKVRFLFVGGNGSRKNPQMMHDAFKTAFGDATDVELVMKEKEYSSVRKYNGQNIVGTPDGNVKMITKKYEDEEMLNLFYSAHCFVLPTMGEGFGLPALEALATGIPSITTEECSEYKDYLGGLGLKSTYGKSPWPSLHPGEVLFPDFDDFVDKLKYVKENVETLLPQFYTQSWRVHERYDWVENTREAFKDIVK